MAQHTAKKTDWKTRPMPRKHKALDLDLSYSPIEYERIRRGVVPVEMEDKWFVYLDRSHLYFHRSWSGLCIYDVELEGTDDGWVVRRAVVNRDPDQYPADNDDYDARMIPWLIDRLLLDGELPFPTIEGEPEEVSAMRRWKLVGGKEPGKDPETK